MIHVRNVLSYVLDAAAMNTIGTTWSASATESEKMLDKPLTLTERLRFEFGLDPSDADPDGNMFFLFHVF